MKGTLETKRGKIANWMRNVFFPYKSENLPSNGLMQIDEAINATGFGTFNYLLLFYSIPASMANAFSTTTMSYVITSAECDLRLSLLDKGVLNAITHVGMITCAFLSGYITDTLGRKKVLIYGYMLDFIINVIAGFSQNFLTLVTLKFISGFIICGPATIVISCLTEFFVSSIQPMFSVYIGACFGIGSLTLPFIAHWLLVSPQDLILGGYVIHSWQVFIFVCSIPSLFTALMSILLPENPRFLLSRGRKSEAMEVLKTIYKINKSTLNGFPVKELVVPSDADKLSVIKVEPECKPPEKKEGTVSALKGGLAQMKPLLRPPHLRNLLLVIAIEFGCIAGCNTLRLWLPQLFKMMVENATPNKSLCEMVSLGNNTNVAAPVLPLNGTCIPIHIDPQTFFNSAIVAGSHLVFVVTSSVVINALGKENLLRSSLFISGIFAISIYWCTSITQAAFLAAFAMSFASIGSSCIISIVVQLFPTSLRAMAVNIGLMFGRIGSISGSLTFPLLLAAGCLPPFLTISALTIGASLIAVFIPKTKKAPT